MNRFLTILIFSFALCNVAFDQKVKVVKGSYTYFVPETMTMQQAKQEALRRAQIEALAAEFGMTMSQSSSTVSSDEAEAFYQEGESLVKGEWIETIGEPEFERGFMGDDVYIKCTVKGRAREIKKSKAELDVKVLRNGVEVHCEGRDFINGDKIYLYFNSPIDGYVAVFLHDVENDVVSCLLPYKRDRLPAVKVEGDKDYVFFSKRMNTLGLNAQEYVMGCGEEREMNTLYVVFSKNEFVKPSLEDAQQKTVLKHLTFKDFNSWLSKTQIHDKDIVVEKMIISITNN